MVYTHNFDDANYNNLVIYSHWNDYFYTGDIWQYAFEGEIYRSDAWVTVNMTQHFIPEENLYELRTTVTQMNSFGAMVNKTEVFLIDPTKQYPWQGKPNGILPFPVRPFYDVKVHGGTGGPGWVNENNATVRHALFTTYHDEHPVSTLPPTTTTPTTVAPPCGEECLIPEGTFCQGNFATGNNKIVGGEEAVPHSWPWIVTLNNGGQYCAGSILNEEWIITAAHCTEGGVNGHTIKAGLHNKHGGQHQQEVTITESYLHSNYDSSQGISNDISMVKVSPPLDLAAAQIGPVCLPEQGQLPPIGETCYVGGWGALQSGGWGPDNLHSVNVNMYEDVICLQDNSYGSSFVPEVEICAGKWEGGKDSCQGDSGGPLVCVINGEPVLTGIVSWGHGCASAGYPGVYAEVNAFIDWMRDTTGFYRSTTTPDDTTTTFEPITTQSTTQTTTEEPTTTTTEEVCPCTDDVTGQIFNGFTPFFAKFGQIKGYAAGANTFVFAMAQTIHDAEKNPGMPAGGHDGYIVIRKYNSCDHTVMEKFADPSVTWEMTDFTCGDCHTSHQGGYFKNDVANKKKTFTLGYSFNNDGTDTNKASQVDKYLLMVSGLQALGVTEQQAFDCLAGAKPANIYGEFMEEGCDYSHCVGEKVLIW